MYQFVVVLIVAMHLVFVGYVLAGGYLALRWRHTIWLHIPAVSWAVLIASDNPAHFDCPLTGLERYVRAAAGMAPLPPEGFIAHYLTGVVYLAAWTVAVEAAVLAVVVGSWALYARAAFRRRRYRGDHARTDHRRRAERLL